MQSRIKTGKNVGAKTFAMGAGVHCFSQLVNGFCSFDATVSTQRVHNGSS